VTDLLPRTEGAYRYAAVGRDGRLRRGTLVASSRDDAAVQLGREGLLAVELAPTSRTSRFMRRSSPAETALVLRVLADLLGAGMPLPHALAALERLAPRPWQRALPTLQQSVREGRGLAAAIRAAKPEVPPLVVGLVDAGERWGDQVAALRRAAQACEEAAATRTAVRSALAYPALLLAAGSVAVALLIGIVLPRFATMITGMGQALPPLTAAVLSSASALRLGALPAGLALVVMIVVWRRWSQGEEGRARSDEILLRLPFVGSVRLAAASSRFCTSLSALLQSGVPVSRAITDAARALGDGALERRIAAAHRLVEQGQRLGTALRSQGALAETSLLLIAAGEDAGTLPSMLAHAARLEGEEVVRRTRSAVALIEPVLILAFGLLVALVSAALLQALYGVRPGG
jgi:type II secretory pathway component PulF